MNRRWLAAGCFPVSGFLLLAALAQSESYGSHVAPTVYAAIGIALPFVGVAIWRAGAAALPVRAVGLAPCEYDLDRARMRAARGRGGLARRLTWALISTWIVFGVAIWRMGGEIEKLSGELEKHRENEELIHTHMWDQMGVPK